LNINANGVTFTFLQSFRAIFRDKLLDRLASLFFRAVVDSALIIIFAVNRSVNDSLAWFTSSNGALAWASDLERCVNTSQFAVTAVRSALVVVITRFFFVLALSIYARICGADVVVIAVLWLVLASSSWVASVNGASVVVVTANGFVLASSFRITRVCGASVVVITRLVSIRALASFRITTVVSANIVVVARNLVNTLSINTLVQSARILVIARDCSMSALSSAQVTLVNSASIVIIAQRILWSVDTSNLVVTRVNGTCNLIITVLLREDTSFVNITRRHVAWTGTLALLCSVEALSSRRIANIISASVVVIANCSHIFAST
jgi:hypothetical protein